MIPILSYFYMCMKQSKKKLGVDEGQGPWFLLIPLIVLFIQIEDNKNIKDSETSIVRHKWVSRDPGDKSFSLTFAGH